MQKMIGVLAVLLAAQLLLAVGLSYTGPDLAARSPDTPLFDLGGRSVDRIVIEGTDKQQLVLARQGDGWVLPGDDNFPADRSKVSQLVERLRGLKHGLAVATTKGAQTRFKVSDTAFERRVQLAQGDETLATLYFGTSPGLHQVHTRTQDDDAVYTTAFANYEASVKPGDWEDQAVLQFPRDEIESMDLGQITLAHTPTSPSASPSAGTAPAGEKKQPPAGVAWSGTGLAAGEAVNQASADDLARQLAGVTIGSVLGREAKPDYGLDKPALTVKVERRGGKAVEYRLGKHDNTYVLKASSRPEYFHLSANVADALLKAAGRNQLVVAASDTTPAGKALPDQAAATAAATGAAPLHDDGGATP